MINKNTIQQENILGSNIRIKILNTTIDVLSEQETVNLVEKYVLNYEPLHLIGVNADKINALNTDPLLNKIVNSCGVINADGASVVLASRFLKKPLPERVAGIDLMDSLMKLCATKGYSVYLLGAKERVIKKAADVIVHKYPKLKIVGIRNGYFDTSKWEEISNDLNQKKPSFVFVGITSPTKEYLVEYLQSKGNRAVFMGVGGSFDVVSGIVSRAPYWMQKMNLEWLYRVMQEPKRLFKRYLFGNVRFVIRVLKAKFTFL